MQNKVKVVLTDEMMNRVLDTKLDAREVGAIGVLKFQGNYYTFQRMVHGEPELTLWYLRTDMLEVIDEPIA